jgi:hypothetical protein
MCLNVFKVGVVRVCKKLGKYLTYNPVVNLVSITDTSYQILDSRHLFIVKSFAASLLNLEDNLKIEEFLSCKYIQACLPLQFSFSYIILCHRFSLCVLRAIRSGCNITISLTTVLLLCFTIFTYFSPTLQVELKRTGSAGSLLNGMSQASSSSSCISFIT